MLKPNREKIQEELLTMAQARNYRKEYDDYHGTSAQKKRRADRNQARRRAQSKGTVSKGDGKEVHHSGSHRTGRLKDIATRILSKHANRIKQPARS